MTDDLEYEDLNENIADGESEPRQKSLKEIVDTTSHIEGEEINENIKPEQKCQVCAKRQEEHSDDHQWGFCLSCRCPPDYHLWYHGTNLVYCVRCKVMWIVGYNLFSGPNFASDEEYNKYHEQTEKMMEKYTIYEDVSLPKPFKNLLDKIK